MEFRGGEDPALHILNIDIFDFWVGSGCKFLTCLAILVGKFSSSNMNAVCNNISEMNEHASFRKLKPCKSYQF